MTGEDDRHVIERLISQSVAPPLKDHADIVAERLLYLVHRGIDWSVWSSRKSRYWAALTERTVAATYAGPTLSAWWQEIGRQMESEPKSSLDRAYSLNLLTADDAGDERVILKSLRSNADVLVLRLRVHVESNREHHA